ncbi:MAG: hypothetical protein PVJ57_10380 [Phycisphaerae bacterium]|jgi:hypothetical protein
MSDDEARRPIRAGQAYLDAIKDDPKSQAALRRAQMRLQAFGAAVRAVMGPVNAAQNTAFAALSEPLRVYHDMGAALGDAMRGDFERLRALVDAYPDLKETADELEQAVLAMKEGDEQRRADITKRFEHVAAALDETERLLNPTPPAFNDPEFWSSIKPTGEQIRDAVREGLREQAESGAPADVSRKRSRVKREIAEQQIMQHLIRRPHDTAEEVRCAVGCSKGVVTESPAWKANQKRLKAASDLAATTGKDVDPIALDLQDYLSPAGDNAGSQLRAHREAAEAADDALDQREQELFRRIAEYRSNHPNATPQEVAKGVGGDCTAGDVERRQAQLDKLVQEQADSDNEDSAITEGQSPRRYHKRV